MTDSSNRPRLRGYRTAHAGDLNPDLPTRKRFPLPPVSAPWTERNTGTGTGTETEGMLDRILDNLHRW